jgi:hypothetical protein
MTLDINDFDHYRNNVDEFPTSTAASREWQLEFRALLEGARNSNLSDDERRRIVRYITEFAGLIYYPAALYPGDFEHHGLNVGDALDAEIAERTNEYYEGRFPRIRSPEIGERE